MISLERLQPQQIEKFTRFLEEHPGFSPLLMGENAVVRGFQIGGSYLRIAEMEQIMGRRSGIDGQEAALLPEALGARVRKR